MVLPKNNIWLLLLYPTQQFAMIETFIAEMYGSQYDQVLLGVCPLQNYSGK
jgi:hypothetical protein